MTMIDLTKRNFEEAEQDGFGTGARFSKAPKSFRARKAIFRSSVSKNGEVYTPETSCMCSLRLLILKT